jgi:hypothetical protein
MYAITSRSPMRRWRSPLIGALIIAETPVPNSVASELTVPERVLLFCLASGTDWFKAGVTPTTAKKMLVKGLIERDGAGLLVLTEHGRSALSALIAM